MTTNVEQIWNDFGDKLRSFIRSRVADDATADDILQDVFVKIASRSASLHDPGKLQGWIFLVARNAVIDHYRTRKITVEVPETLPDDQHNDEPEIEQVKEALWRIIDAMPENYLYIIHIYEPKRPRNK